MKPETATERSFCEGELRSVVDEATGIRTIIGYAAIWGALSSVPLRTPKGEPFWERTVRGAFLDGLDSPYIGCFFDHDTGKPLGRTGAGTLTVNEDDRGLLFQCIPDMGITYARNLGLSIDRRDVAGCSVGFYNVRDSWARDGQGRLIRTVEKARLFDVSPVSRPTFTETAVAFRSLDQFLAQEEVGDPEEVALLARRVRLAALLGRR